MKIVIAASAVLVALASGPATAAPIDAIRAGDMQQMIPEIIAVYENEGLSWDHGIEWNVGPFTTTYWFYDPNVREITAGAVPADSEIETYWQTWSNVLTDGNFEPTGFFASEAEARELARYNQYVLATHESAHAITFRYDYPHLQRHDYDINCREFYADRLTVSILNEQARLEPDMARWRDRYRDLVTAMGETIPEQYRHHIPDFAALDADCGVIDVAQPTPETMQPYASAFFERYRVLLEADLPPMASVFKTHLSDVWDAAHATIPYAPQSDRLRLATLKVMDEVKLGTDYGVEQTASEVVTRAAAFDPDGQLWYATVRYNRDTRMSELSFGPQPASPVISGPGGWLYPSMRLEITSLAVLSEDLFLYALEHWDREGEEGAERYFISFVVASRENDGWVLTALAHVDGMKQGAILRAPDNRLFMIASPESNGRDPTAGWRGFEISLDREDVVAELPIKSSFDFPLAIDGEGRLYEQLAFSLWGSTPEGSDAVVIGNGHMGARDGIGAAAEISDLQVFQWMADGRALFIDRDPGWDNWLLRELTLAE